jgi:hypothetical protein
MEKIDEIYVNSVVAHIRETSIEGTSRGLLWESIHKCLLQLKGCKAALESVASAGGDADLDVLKEETKQLFYKLKQECRDFSSGKWEMLTSTANSTANTDSLPPLTSGITSKINTGTANTTPFLLTSTTPHTASMSQKNSIIDRALGIKEAVIVERLTNTWEYNDRTRVASELLQCIKDLGIISCSFQHTKHLTTFIRDHILLRIEPCNDFCLTGQDISNLMIDLLMTHSRRLPIATNQLHDWRNSSLLSSKISKILVQCTKRLGKSLGNRRRSRNIGNQIKFCCSSLTVEAAKDFVENDGRITAEYAVAADAACDRLLSQIHSSIHSLTPIDSRISFEVSKAMPV